ncbi:MAG: hypothetical protein ACE5HZ_01880 [Fidelibacterota bacterium]
MHIVIPVLIALLMGMNVPAYAQKSDTVEYAGRESKFFGDYYVGEGEVSQENIRVFGGDLFVAGQVDGQITVLGGDVTLEPTAVVNGRIVAIGGSVLRKEGAVVNGKVMEANIREGITYSEGTTRETEPRTREFGLKERGRALPRIWTHRDTYWFVYNRNEGLLLTPFNWHWDRQSRSSLRLSFTLGYRFGQKQTAGRLTLEKRLGQRFFPPGIPSLLAFASAFRQTRTDDDYRLPEMENSLASLLARQDFYDRWDEEGAEVGLAMTHPVVNLNGAYRVTEIDSLSVTRRQARVFQKDRLFRKALAAIPDNVRTVLATVRVKTVALDPLTTGLGFAITAERILQADLIEPFTRWLGRITANWEVAPDVVLRSRFLAGSARGTLPDYRFFAVGGLGSVSAYPYKDQKGDRMVQVNSELILLPEFIGRDWLISLFSDLGHAWMHADYEFSNTGAIIDHGISSIGVGVGDEDLDWRINVARPLDGRDIWETTFRVNLNF